MPKITVNVARAGHPILGGTDTSTAGHMWITMPDGTTTGYAPGGETDRDGNTYDPGYYSQEVELTDAELKRLQDFVNNPSEHGFGEDDYNAAWNSCVDYTWAALREAGQNPDDFEGDLFPGNNIDDLQRLPRPGEEPPDKAVNDLFERARQFFPRRDPLSFDLDGDGLETTAISPSNATLFDHDGDGVRTGTGWLKEDDGFLAIDLNGNGTIDNGSELFGVDTALANGQKAKNGFEALADLDSNQDDHFDNQDIQYVNLRIWRDLNQDGISQVGELESLEEAGIADVNLKSTATNVLLVGGNVQTATGLFTRTDGQTGTLGEFETGTTGNLDLAQNPFYREFTDAIQLTDAARTVPDMKGSGSVRDLKEAASLSEPLAVALQNIADAGWQSKAQLISSIDPVIDLWAKTSMLETSQQRAAELGFFLAFRVPGATDDEMLRLALENQFDFDSGELDVFSPVAPDHYASIKAESKRLSQMISILEAFNGQTFLDFPETGGVRMGSGVAVALRSGTLEQEDEFGFPTQLSLSYSFAAPVLTATHIQLLEDGYHALKQSVYDGLALQTRLKPYMDAVGLIIGENSLSFDFGSVTSLLEARYEQMPGDAVRDLLDIQRLVGSTLNGLGWDGYAQLQGWLATTASLSDTEQKNIQLNHLAVAMAEFGYGGLRASGDGTVNSEVVIAGQGATLLSGNGGNDLILGADEDNFIGGGVGNDVLYGGAGNDTYIFNLGDGLDSIIESQGTGGTDALSLGTGIVEGDLTVTRNADNLVFTHANGRDRISIANWFDSLDDEAHRLDSIRFADGHSFDLSALQLGTIQADTLIGDERDNLLAGDSGSDVLDGQGGNDWMDGGAGIDQMSGGVGNDVYVVDNTGDLVMEATDGGSDTVDSRISYALTDNVENLRLVGAAPTDGTGNALDNTLRGNDGNNHLFGAEGTDVLTGNGGNDVLDGGAGNDLMTGGIGSDTYVVDAAGDQIIELVGQGTDTVNSDISYTLGNHLENLTLTGVGTIDGTGNAFGNVLTGNEANNTLIGLDGNDTLYGSGGADNLIGGTGDDSLNGGTGSDHLLGGAGNDTYVIDENGDAVIELAAEGTDTVQSSIHYTLNDNVENLTLTGTANLAGVGNTLNNTLVGNDGVNTLRGLEGNDVLNGGKGNDVLIGGVGNDTYVIDSLDDVIVENADEGVDTVQSTITVTLDQDLENLTLIGGTSINGTGNADDNVLTGNSAGNVLDGGLGDDTMAGGNGDDTYLIDSHGDHVVEFAGQGSDTVITPFDTVLSDNVDNLILVGSALQGTGNALNNTLTGNELDNTLIGEAGNDLLIGGGGADVMAGGLGNDTYVADSLLDTLSENANEGVDTVKTDLTWTLGANLDNLTLTGTQAVDGTGNALANELTGNGVGNTLVGLSGDDTLDGGAGADVLFGGAGNDTYVVDNGGDVVSESAAEGLDHVKASVSYTLTDNVEHLTLTGGASISGTGNTLDNVVTGNGAGNLLSGLAGNDVLIGGGGADTLVGGSGDDTYVVDQAGDQIVEIADEGNDLVQSSASYTLADNIETLVLTGSANLSGTGNAQANAISGNGGANTLDGGLGADTLAGGAGNDTYLVDDAGDVVLEQAASGNDTVLTSVSYALSDNIESLTLTGTANLSATGNTLGNIVTGNSGDNVLLGMEGRDRLVGNAGNDVLDGGSGGDGMLGGIGNDTYRVDDTLDIVNEMASEGNDLVESSVSYTLTANVENLSLLGGAAIDGRGNELDNAINGNSANNVLDGLAGADRMVGNGGDDTYRVDNVGDTIVEAIAGGVDSVETSVSFTLADNVENLLLIGGADLAGTGNQFDNAITGNTGNNILDGGEGIDTLTGGLGDDTYLADNTGDHVIEAVDAGLDTVQASVDYTLSDNVENLILTGSDDVSGTGNALDNVLTSNDGTNTLSGQAGNDTYVVNDTADVVVEIVGDGVDTVKSSATYTLSANVENLELTGNADVDGTGNDAANNILGNAGRNVIDGGSGVDTMAGAGGDDTYLVDRSADTVSEAANAGIDTVISSATYTLSANVENLTLTGDANIDATGNELDNVLIGNAGNNRLYGLNGSDTLAGNVGNDLLDGGSGADRMSGNAGDDTYLVDNAGDAVAELAEEGTDTVQASISYTLTDAVENLTLAGSASINGTGNSLANAIVGNSGNNVLDGGIGVDTLTGGAGNDTYVVNETADVVVESLNAGTDSVLSSATYTLSDNVENLTLTGTADIDGTGNALSNVITANSGFNVLTGRGGNDTYVIDSTDDVVVENLNEGTDLVQSSATYTLSGNVENLTLTGGANIDGTGNTLNNVIVGNTGNNLIDGGAGADSMSGGTGNDTYIVDNATDTVSEGANAGIDLVYSSVSHTLSANVENLTLTGSGDINGTGNNLNNILLGTVGHNRLDGSTGADSMAGGLGNDTYVVDNTGDLVTEVVDEGVDKVESSISYTLTANVENLTLTGSASINGAGNALDNVIVGNTGNNVLSGLSGNDAITGGGGNDTLDGGLDVDTMTGGQGNDTYVVDNAGDLVTEILNEGTDLVNSSITYALTANVENLTLTGTAEINGAGNILANLITGNVAANIIDAGAGSDTVNAGAGNDVVTGGDGNDTLSGEAGSDTITGDAGNDTLNGGLDADSMAGGTGDDTYVVDHVGDLVTENAGEGIDLVQSSITYTLTDNAENLTLTGSANIQGNGNELSNVILGNSGANTLVGLEGNDTLNGGAGIDSMLGGVGNDTYVVDNTADVVIELADEGIDLVQASATYTLSADVENLTLTGTASINGTGNGLGNVLIGNTGNNVLSGLAGNDSLTGSSGNDTLDGGLDVDTMVGGQGNDIYVVDNAGDLVTEALNEGTDQVNSSITYTLTSNVENLTLTGVALIDGTGNTLNNVIVGSAADNVVSGLAGNDTLSGGAGNDTMSGGDGDDTVTGDAGNDALSGAAGNDTLNGGLDADSMLGGLGNDTYVVDNIGDLIAENANEGTDLVQSSITYTLTDNVENLTLTGTANINGTGNDLNNIVTGNTGANTLSGLQGNDTLNGNVGVDTLWGGDGNDALNGDAGNDALYGDAGNDTLNGGLDIDAMSGGLGDDVYIVDNLADVVIENADEGTDLVQSSVSYALSSNVENLTLTGTANINGTGNALNNVIVGNTGNNSLSGLAGNDTLTGSSGNDVLDGGTGADSMAGGLGNDTYVVDEGADVVSEVLNEGTDLVQSGISYTLGANLENLTLTGSENLNGTGNTLNNVLSGNAGNNILDGAAGADSLIGGLGDDTYLVDNSSDVITEAIGGGFDTVSASANTTLSANLENLTLTGTANLSGAGNASDNVLRGNTGNNTLSGDAGNDRLDGGLGGDAMSGGIGDDIFVVDNAGDTVNEAASAGNDTVESSVSYTLTANVERLVLVGAGDLSGVGNGLGNAMTGTIGNNTLDGAAGADTLIGGAGNDTYLVDSSGDVVIELAGEGVDTVSSSISTSLADNVENLVLTGVADLAGSGNTVNNALDGNAGNNLLSGGEGDDVLTGNAGNDVLNGGLGADQMSGGVGNDTYVVDSDSDLVAEMSGAGTDTVLASINYTLGDQVENLTLTGTASLTGNGNALVNVIQGNAADNNLNGLAGNDTLLGDQGADFLDGGDGADLMAGGDGNDVYVVGDLADAVIEQSNEGSDTVLASIGYSLGAEVENLTLIGSADLVATGNALNNVLVGNSGNNVLSGGDGADALYGASGSDLLLGGAGNDTYRFGLGDGSDRIEDIQGSNALHFNGTLTERNLEAERVGDDMLIHVIGSDDYITLSQWFVSTEGVNTITFEDGSSLDRIGIEELMNRPPVANTDALSVTENNAQTTFLATDLLANDTDPNPGDVLSVVSVGESEFGAEVSLASGELRYGIGDDYQSLAEGETVQDRFVYTITDNEGAQATGLVEVSIVGVNDTPVLATDVGATTEDSTVPVTGNLLTNDSDVDHGTVLSVAEPGLREGVYGALSVNASGEYAYQLDNVLLAVQALAEGQTALEVFDYVATDGLANVVSQLEISVTGVNDAPVVNSDVAYVYEDTVPSVNGNVLTNDSDIDAGTVLSVTAPGLYQGSFGTLDLAADGSYQYDIDNDATKVQSLGRTAQVAEQFGYTATDGMVGTESQLSVSLSGTNDAPIVVKPLADQNFTFHKPFSWQMAADTFADIDQGDVLDYTATLADGSALPDWVKFDAQTQTFSGWTPKEVGYIDIRVTATDRVAAINSTEGSLSVADVFRLTVSHGNQGVGNGEDAAPAGQSENFNDGPGTASGNPGARLMAFAFDPSSDEGAAPSVNPDQRSADTESTEAPIAGEFLAPLSAEQWGAYFDSSASRQGDEAVNFSRWLAVNQAVSEALADKKTLTWADDRHGADTSALNMGSQGYLGSSVVLGNDTVSLLAGSGHDLKSFQGLGQGMKKVA